MSSEGLTTEFDAKIPMRDGIKLSADIFRPRGGGKHPVILMRTPYDNNGLIGTAIKYARRGYAVVGQDCRGRYDSDGEFYPWHQEAEDGFDTLEWIGSQPWCDGNVGMIGASYLGLVQWLVAPLASPYLKTIVPRVITSNFYDSPNYAGGAFQLALNMTWGFARQGHSSQPIEHYHWGELFRTLPLITADQAAGRHLPFWKDWVGHPSYDDYWRQVSIEERYHQIQIPALIMGGWYDLYSKQTLTNFTGMREQGGNDQAREHTKAILGAWEHGVNATVAGEVEFGQGAIFPLEDWESRWLDYWLKGEETGITDEAPLSIFVMGANEWRTEQEWPLARTQFTNYYLRSGGRANSLHGDGTLSPEEPGDEPPDQFTYDPDRPVPTIGGNHCCGEILRSGAFDQRPVERRDDVLVYTTPPLERDLEVTGPVIVKLYASSSARDTDFTGKLLDVFPNGYAMNLCDGIRRARYRNSFEEPELITPGEAYEITIDCWVTSNVFKRGHRIRLDISSSNFPRFDRNSNTGHEFGMDAELQLAEQTVLHSRQYPSHVILPVVPV